MNSFSKEYILMTSIQMCIHNKLWDYFIRQQPQAIPLHT